VNRVELRLANAQATDAVMGAVRAELMANAPTLAASDWRERNKSLFSALQLERIVMFIVLGFIVLVASLLIVSSLVMLIVEKSREIAILKALGASGATIVRVFLLIGAVIGAIGSASGTTLGVLTCLAIETFGVPLPQEYYITELPVDLDWLEVAIVGLAGFAVCILATIYPSREASALKPVEGLRHG
ncbi:MAG: FtsX-like permease family protein, partial [Myxococcota bacterium]|nr:FtsX-like permease family protein [Myxococcota bacterium]